MKRVSVALLLPGVGSVQPVGAVTVAVLLRLPVAVESINPVTVKVAVPPDSRLTSTFEIFPLPLNGPEEPVL